MTDDTGPRIVLDIDTVTVEPGHLQPDQGFTVLWMERNDGHSPSEAYTDSVRLRYTNGTESASDLTCTPLAAGEAVMRSMEVHGGLPAGVGATIDIWVAYDLYKFDESPEHHRAVHINPVQAPAGAGSAPKPYPGSVLKLHSHGEDVRTWQTRLHELGYDLVPDGSFGPATEGHTRQFQLDRELHVDGVVGEHTWEAAWK